MALKNELGNFSFDIHPRANARGPLLIWIGFFSDFVVENPIDFQYKRAEIIKTMGSLEDWLDSLDISFEREYFFDGGLIH